MITIRANLVSLTGRPNKLLIPPRSSRALAVTKEGEFYKYMKDDRTLDPIQVKFGYFVVEHDLALKSIFGTANLFTFGSIEETFDIILYNGGIEHAYIEHEQI